MRQKKLKRSMKIYWMMRKKTEMMKKEVGRDEQMKMNKLFTIMICFMDVKCKFNEFLLCFVIIVECNLSI